MKLGRFFVAGFSLFLIGESVVFTVGLMPFMGVRAVYGTWQLAIYLSGCIAMMAGFVLASAFPAQGNPVA